MGWNGLLPRRALGLAGRGVTLPAGVQIEHVADDGRALTVALRAPLLRVDAPHSGAALYALTDPACVLLLQRALGPAYLVWDKAGSIDLLGNARGRVWARIEVTAGQLAHIGTMTAAGERHLHLHTVDLKDADGMRVARVHRMLYVRRRREAAVS